VGDNTQGIPLGHFESRTNVILEPIQPTP